MDDIPKSDIMQVDTQIKASSPPKPAVKSEPTKEPAKSKPKPAPKKEVKQLAATLNKDSKKESKKELKQPAVTPKAASQIPTPTTAATPSTAPPPLATPIQPQPARSPSKHAVPQVTILAPSQDFRPTSPKPTLKKPQPKKQPSQQSTDKVTKPTKPPVDYQVLLLSLADEYLNAAHRHGTKTALVTTQVEVEEYYKLVSTGLACLEAVLKVSRVLNLV
jgi:hypothetical protein